MPQPRIRLVVTGDDFGYCPRRNRGIVECFLSGAVSNVSLLVNAGSAKDGAELARRYSIPIGLHANLSEGLPICEQLQKGSSLVNHKGYFHGKMGFRKALRNGQLNMAEVELELRAQVTLFCDLTGHLPHHMDGHQHVHILPGVREVFACVMSDCQIRFTRVPLEPGLQACSWLPLHLRDFYTQVEQDARESVGVFLKHGIRWPDVYIGLTTMGRNMSVARIKTAISHALETPPAKENGMTSHRPELALVSGLSERDHVLTMELMVHPGYPSLPLEGGCGEGPDDFSQSSDRQHEMETLKDPRLLKFYKETKIQLCAFKDL
ncbi:carbohydrate deacetylase isoform X1 [Lepisosteus oculatus]|uniref:carbohydrate deacetylase isoform X1 n=1 Tax=Lepisosteus oculatus TaxID=7918 RepID=UPI0035F50BE4